MKFRTRRQKYIDAAFATYDKAIRDLEEEVRRLRNGYVSLDSAKKRDYIVRTNYIGKIKDKKLLADYKKEIEQQLEDKFEVCCNDILNYNFYDLPRFREILNLYEMKQIILDTYSKKDV